MITLHKQKQWCINEAYFENEEDDNTGDYSEEQVEELCKLQDTNSKWLHIQEVHVNEVGDDTSPILYRVRVNDQPAKALFDTGASMSVISTSLFDSLKHKPKIIECSRTLRGTGSEALIPKDECFLQIKIGRQIFRDRLVIVHNLNQDYIIGTVLQRSYHVATGFSITVDTFCLLMGRWLCRAPPHLQ